MTCILLRWSRGSDGCKHLCCISELIPQMYLQRFAFDLMQHSFDFQMLEFSLQSDAASESPTVLVAIINTSPAYDMLHLEQATAHIFFLTLLCIVFWHLEICVCPTSPLFVQQRLPGEPSGSFGFEGRSLQSSD